MLFGLARTGSALRALSLTLLLSTTCYVTREVKASAAVVAGCGSEDVRLFREDPVNDEWIGCRYFYVRGSDLCAPNGITADAPSQAYQNRMDTQGFHRLDVRVVYYAPRPPGVIPGQEDVYTPHYRLFHRRDLWLIANVLKANTIRLEPWDEDISHDDFLDLCSENGIFVIPTFDFKYFFTNSIWKNQPMVVRQNEIVKRFDELLKGARSKQILAWSLNHALMLNETVQLGKDSDGVDNVRQEYFRLLEAVRKVHFLREYSHARGSYLRPLALPIDLSSQISVENVRWYTAYAEAVWGKWPHTTPAGFKGDLERLKALGAFDVWIAEALPMKDDLGARLVINSALHFNGKKSKTTYAFPECKEDLNCVHPTEKAVLLQFGFSSLDQGQLTQPTVDHDSQQLFLKLVRDAQLRMTKEKTACLAGTVVDEWVDDWTRCGTMGYDISSFEHAYGTRCSEAYGGQLIEPEWLGLNAQYSFLGVVQCVEPRYLPTEANPDQSNFFRFEPWPEPAVVSARRAAQEMPYLLCQPGLPNLVETCITCLCIILVTLIVCFRLCKICVSTRRTKRTRTITFGVDENGPRQTPRAHRSGSGGTLDRRPSYSSLTGSRLSVQNSAVKASVHAKVPLQVGGGLLYPMGCDKIGFVLEASDMLANELQLTLEGHVCAQVRRLWHQVTAEAYAVEAVRLTASKRFSSVDEGQTDHESSYIEAMENVHARALEGYVAWLEADKKAPTHWLRTVAGLDTPLQPWELYAEVLLLRVVESLAEQALHSPEYIHAHFHKIRSAVGGGLEDPKLPQDVNFTIDYGMLHSAVRTLVKNSDPYSGGVNFDDINDCGTQNSLDVRKTYWESTSLLVVFDIISNFYPVMFVKIWLFAIAWYIRLGWDKRNGGFLKPKWRRANFLQSFLLLEAFGTIVLELLLLVHGAFQGRFRWHRRGRWLMKRFLSLISASLALKTMFIHQKIDSLVDFTIMPEDVKELDQDIVLVCCVTIAQRMFTFFLTTRASSNTSFLPGRPSIREGVTGPRGLHRRPTRNSSVGQTQEDEDGWRRFHEVPLVVPSEAEIEEESSHSMSSPFVQAPRSTSGWLTGSARGKGGTESDLLSRVAWGIMLAICFLFEIFYVAPLASSFDFDRFCGETCKVMSVGHFMDVEVKVVGGTCSACVLSLVFSWWLVALTATFDIYYVFYAGTAVFGYAMGEYRGLRNVLCTALRHLDFCVNNSYVGRNAGIGHAMRIEITDGEAMRRTFGFAWRQVWSRIVEALYEECLVTDREADAMVKAADTARFQTIATQSEKYSSPDDMFRKLRFIATANRSGLKASDVPGVRRRCISALRVLTDISPSPVVLEVTENTQVEVEIDREEDYENLRKSLGGFEVGSVTLDALPELGVEAGMILVSANLDLVEGVFEDYSSLGVLVFSRPGVTFDDIIIDLPAPCHVRAVSFKTSSDSVDLDPVQWRVEGLLATDSKETDIWKPLVRQRNVYYPPRCRLCYVPVFFHAEFWQSAESMRSPSRQPAFDLQNCSPAVHERVGFFAASLRMLLKTGSKYSVRYGIDTLLDARLGNLPSLSQIIPCYSETVILGAQMLIDSDGVNTNLAFIISQCPAEWENFARKRNQTANGLYRAFLSAASGASSSTLEPAARRSLVVDVRLWASMRSQTVARTIVGAMQYQDFIAMLPCVQSALDPREALESCVELLLAHQTYGSKAGSEANDADVRFLLRRYHNRSFYLVYDFDRSKMRPIVTAAIDKFVRSRGFAVKLSYASVLARYRQEGKKEIETTMDDCGYDAIEIVELMPRRYPLLVGSPGFLSQGKAGNQLNALRFSRGHFLQMMDANMGAFFGEACKVPFVVRRFLPSSMRRDVVQARIIGFRESIFTEYHGAVGKIMASAEWTFGTICQRFLAGLGARMHYGHPDFLDGFWASSRGSLSKASASINLSEDIFAGFNVTMRGERSTHVDSLVWEKGREASFNAASLFFTKISKGNVGVMRSRDLKVITESLSVMDNFSFYFASIGFYLNNLLIDFSCLFYLFLFVLLVLASKALKDISELDSLLATEWMLSLGIIAMFPRFMELVLEFGPMEGILRFLPSIPGCMALFTFMNKSISAGVMETMKTGEANYIATGRPNSNTHYSWRECYFIHVKTHYYPAIQVYAGVLIYQLLSSELGYTHLPMMVLLVSAGLWLVAPILFCPQPTLATLESDLREFWYFIIAAPGWSIRHMDGSSDQDNPKPTEALLRSALGDKRSTLYDFWLLEALQHKKAPMARRMGNLLGAIFLLVVAMSILPWSLVGKYWCMLQFIAYHMMITEVWRLLYRPAILTLCSLLTLFVAPMVFYPDMSLLAFIALTFVTHQFLKVARHVILLAVWMVLRPNVNAASRPEKTEEERETKRAALGRVQRYDIVVEYFYINFLTHQEHMLWAGIILVVNLVTQTLVVALEMTCGLHSWLLLNRNLRSKSICAKRSGYVPGSAMVDGEQGQSFFGDSGRRIFGRLMNIFGGAGLPPIGADAGAGRSQMELQERSASESSSKSLKGLLRG